MAEVTGGNSTLQGLKEEMGEKGKGEGRERAWCVEQGKEGAARTLYTARDTKVISAVLGAVFVRRKNQ